MIIRPAVSRTTLCYLHRHSSATQVIKTLGLIRARMCTFDTRLTPDLTSNLQARPDFSNLQPDFVFHSLCRPITVAAQSHTLKLLAQGHLHAFNHFGSHDRIPYGGTELPLE
jgi:hypothetical protein